MKAAPVVSCARKVAGARCGARMVREITGGVGYIMPGGTRRRAT
jgi:hypothetical protein